MTFNQLNSGREEAIIEPDLPIVDAHHHLFLRPGIRYLLEDYLADAGSGHNIVASVYCETQAFSRAQGPEMFRPLGEIEFANGIGAMADSGLLGGVKVCTGIVGHADLRFGARIGEYLDQAIALAPQRLKGIRQITLEDPSGHAANFMAKLPDPGIMAHPEFRNGLREVGQRGLSFDVSVFQHQMDDLCTIIDSMPDVRFVLNHSCHMMALGLGPDDARSAVTFWQAKVRKVAQRPNVVNKIGGLGLPFWGFGFQDRKDSLGYLELANAWRPFIELAIEAFGPDRCMMESNYPVDGRSCGYVPLWNALKHVVRSASRDEKNMLFSGTAIRTYRLSLNA